MKVVLLAGGYGTRISEETDIKSKPMVEIGGKPILWHIMKMYSAHGFNDFVILLGYKSKSSNQISRLKILLKSVMHTGKLKIKI